MAGGTGGCRPDNLRCHQWRRGWRRGGSQNSVAYWLINVRLWLDKQCKLVTGRYRENIVDAGFVMAGGTGGCRPDNLRCHQWRRGWRRGGSQNSVAYWLINVRLWLDKQCKLVTGRYRENIVDAGFVMAGGTGGCRPDNLRCHQWRRGWRRGGSQNSVAYWLINVRLWLDKQCKLVTGRYRENIVDAGFVMAGGTGGCRPDNLRCHQWRRGWRRGGSQNSVAYWLINVRLWLDKQCKLVTGRYRENIVDAGFVMAGGTGGCRPDNLRCHQWRRGWRRGGSQNSVAYWLINVRLWLDKQCKLVTGRYRENIVDAGFVMAGGTGGCRPDNLRCHQWRRGWRRGGSQNSVAYWLINVRLWLDKQCKLVTGRYRENIVDAGFVMAGGTGGCRPDNLRCHQWRRGWRRGGSQNSVAYWLINVRLWLDKQCKLVTGRYRENIVDAGFVMAGGTGGCRPDKLRCHQWRCGRRRGDSQFSLFLPLIVTLTIVQCSYMCLIFN